MNECEQSFLTYELRRFWFSEDHRLEDRDGVPAVLRGSVQHLEVVLGLHEDEQQTRQSLRLRVNLKFDLKDLRDHLETRLLY